MSETLTGADYRARTPIYGKDQAGLDDGTPLADVGETCDRVPATSVPWLLAQGHIEPLRDDAPPIASDEPGAA